MWISVEDVESWAMAALTLNFIHVHMQFMCHVMSVCNVRTVQVHDKASDQIIPAWLLFTLITCTGADRHVTELGSHPP